MNAISKYLRDRRNARELAHRRAVQAKNTSEGMEAFQKKLLEDADTTLEAVIAVGDGAFRTNLPQPKFALTPYVPPEFIGVPDKHVIAMDAMLPATVGQASAGMFSYGGFPGFPFLTELTQVSEYRDLYEPTANEMTRKWIELRSTGDDKREDAISKIEEVMNRLHVKEWFNWAGKTSRSMGRAQLFVDFGDDNDKGEELDKPLLIDPAKIAKGSLKRIKGIEPITTYPAAYNADDPLAQDYYEPSSWFVYSRQVHTSRLLTFIPYPLPDLLKPVYNFSGMSITQLGIPYVEYWHSTRDSVGRLLKNYSTTVFKTNMAAMLSAGADKVQRRLKLFTAIQNSQGVFMCDKDTEELSKEATALAGLSDLKAQAQENMASVSKTPLTIMFGLSPKGLTSTAETDITIFNNHVHGCQESEFRRPLEALVKIIMCSEFGEIYDDITFDFVDLVDMTEKERSEMRKADGATDVGYITAGVVTPEEVRDKLAGDPSSGYNNLDVDKPEGKLVQPAPAGKAPAPDKGQQSQASQSAMEDAQEDNESSNDSVLRAAADIMLDDAARMAHDAGLWPGNQHTDKLNDDDPTNTAMRHSAVAQKATNVAHKTDTRAFHLAAHKAHARARAAHEEALVSATRQHKHLHETYIDAHEAAMAHHKMESAPLPEAVEL
jgi:phage-related protein (TIGR01555 family)